MPKIEQMYAFCAEEKPEDEGVIGFRGPDGSWLPLVGADMGRINSLEEIAIAVGGLADMRVVLKKFKLVSEEVVFTPKRGGQ
jgi:hypothetical protein